MTVRINRVGAITVYAGTPDELAAIADTYARGERKRPHGYEASLFCGAADKLRGGYRVLGLGAVRFYGDRADGTPFRAPYAPMPDPEWGATHSWRHTPAGL